MPVEPPRRIGVVGYARYAALGETAEKLASLCSTRDLAVHFEPDLLPIAGSGQPLTDEVLPDLDLLFTLGGDGTLLRGARLVADHGIPVLGINLGRLGFLTSISPDELESSIASLLRGEVTLDERMVLRVELVTAQGGKQGEFLAINDVVLHRGGVARMIRMKIRAHEDEVGTYSADGLILSTPTGSTAYSLSAGGPIVSPSFDCIIATPICPHTLAVRPLVLSAEEKIDVEVLYPDEELILTIDGQESARMHPGDRLVVTRAPKPLRIVRFPGQTFFSTLRRKLGWGDLGERDREE